MSELDLTLTKEFDSDTVRLELGEYLRVGAPKILFFKSADPPSVLQLLGDPLAWLPLKAAAAVYLSTLAKRAGEATWDWLASRFNSNEVRPLADVAKTLAKAATSVDGKVIILAGLNIPDDSSGTAISVEPGDPEEVARVLALFIVYAEQISEAMWAQVEAGRKPCGGARIELQDDGRLLIRWTTADFCHHELRIPSV